MALSGSGSRKRKKSRASMVHLTPSELARYRKAQRALGDSAGSVAFMKKLREFESVSCSNVFAAFVGVNVNKYSRNNPKLYEKMMGMLTSAGKKKMNSCKR